MVYSWESMPGLLSNGIKLINDNRLKCTSSFDEQEILLTLPC